MPTLTLRTLSASAFTTKGFALDDEEFDNNFIQLKAEIDALNTTIGAISIHTQNEDTILNQGGGNEVSAAQLKLLVDQVPNIASGDALKTLRVNAAETSIEFLENAYAMYFEINNAGETNISAAGTFENINCTLAEGDVPAVNFSVSGNIITYDGDDPIKVLVNWVVSALKTGGGAGDDIEIKISVGGDQKDGSGHREANNTNLGSFSMTTILSLTSGQDIALLTTNVDSTSNINIKDQTITIVKIP